MSKVPRRGAGSANRSENGIQVVHRAAQILRALVGEHSGLSLSQIAERVELPRSTVHRIVVALEKEGLAASASPNGRYRLGSEVTRLATGQHGDLRFAVRPFLEELAVTTEETVDLSVLMRDQVVFIDQVPAPHRLRAVSTIGAAFPAHCTANGKSLLSAYSDDVLRKLLPARLEAFTKTTITDRRKLLDHLAQVRESGVAYDREEHTPGICAVGASVRDPFGVVAAISVPVPTQRFTSNETALARALTATCSRVTDALGGSSEP